MKSPFFHLILWLVVCAAVLAGYGYWYSVVANKSTALADLQSQINAKNDVSLRVAQARSALAEISGDESLVQSYFVPDTGVVSFIDGQESLARSQGSTMKVLSVSTSGTDKQSNLALLLTISIDGTFDSLLRTIGAVEYAPYDISVSNLSVTQESKNAWHADLELIVGSVPSATTASSTPVAAPAAALPSTT